MGSHPYSSRGGVTVGNTIFTFTSGEEGPKYDPYSWEEISALSKDGKVITIHMGLAQWLKIDEKELKVMAKAMKEHLNIFGISVKKVESVATSRKGI